MVMFNALGLLFMDESMLKASLQQITLYITPAADAICRRSFISAFQLQFSAIIPALA